MLSVLDSVRNAWLWLRPKLKWVGLALLVIGFVSMALGRSDESVLEMVLAAFTFGLFRRRPRAPDMMSAKDAKHLADAVRPALEKRAEQALKEAEEHRGFAEKRVDEATAERQRIASMSPEQVLKESEAYAARVRKRGKGGPLLVLLAALSVASAVRAQDVSAPFIMPHPATGEAGFWIPDAVWRSALADALALPKTQAAVSELRYAIDMHLIAETALKQQVEFEQALSAEAWKQLSVASAELKRERRWIRSPRILVPLGIVLGAAAVIAPAVAFR